MKLTFKNRLKLCWEILTISSGHDHSAVEKQLSSFQNGYRAGKIDNQKNVDENIKNHIRDESITDLVTFIERYKDLKSYSLNRDIYARDIGNQLHNISCHLAAKGDEDTATKLAELVKPLWCKLENEQIEFEKTWTRRKLGASNGIIVETIETVNRDICPAKDMIDNPLFDGDVITMPGFIQKPGMEKYVETRTIRCFDGIGWVMEDLDGKQIDINDDRHLPGIKYANDHIFGDKKALKNIELAGVSLLNHPEHDKAIGVSARYTCEVDANEVIKLPNRRDPSPISNDEIENAKWASYCAGANDLIDTWCLGMVRAFNDVLADMSNAEKELAHLRNNIADYVDGYLVEQTINNDIEFVYFQTYVAAQKFSFNGDSIIHPVRLANLKPNPLLHQVVTKEFLDNLIHDRDCIMEERDKLLSVVDGFKPLPELVIGQMYFDQDSSEDNGSYKSIELWGDHVRDNGMAGNWFDIVLRFSAARLSDKFIGEKNAEKK